MADEAFALSPISARAAQPSEADYDAIQEAFMETSRGRWFLGEYAKRNRNADTRMVLDAVARIEQTISAAKKPTRDPLLDEALTSLRAALADARSATTAAIGDLALEQNLAPVRKGARVIREIAWRLREIGADGRICDLIDSQVGAIEGAAGRLHSADLAAALHGAFERVERQLAAFDAADETTPSSPPEAANAAPAETHAEVQPEPSEPEAKVEIKPEIKTVAADAVVESTMALASEIAGGPIVAGPIDAFDANDEAVLDRVAMEMAAFDTDDAYEPRLEDAEIYEGPINGHQVRPNMADAPKADTQQTETHQAETVQPNAAQSGPAQSNAASWEIDVTFASDTGASNAAASNTGRETARASAAAGLPIVTPLPSVPQPAAESVPDVVSASAPSLGSSLLANGIVPRPRAAGSDPLAPIRRMTQNERIAFFS